MDQGPPVPQSLTGPSVADGHCMATEPCRALVVEDDTSIASLFAAILRREKFEVDVAGNGDQALEKIRANGYHLMVIDLMLPQTNGRKVIEYIREHHLETLNMLIAVSADASAIRGSYPEDICKFLAKPFDVDEFVQHVHACKKLCQAG